MGRGVLLGQEVVNPGEGWNGQRGPLILSGFLTSPALDFLTPGLDGLSLPPPQLSLWRTFQDGNGAFCFRPPVV